jgi:hypothetical protein
MANVAIADPITWDRIIYLGTDHVWTCRRVTIDAVPIIPDMAYAQIRNKPYGVLWATIDVTVDPIQGWITCTLLKEDIEDSDWQGRKTGVWDIEVDYSGMRLRWVEGAITVSQEVTIQ